ncbi:MAG: Lar family restriction alleviation protein [Gammaproteobacteria bacterium]
MATAKNTRAAKRRARKTTERPTTATERDEAVRVLLEDGQLNAVRKGYFCDADLNMPIAGTPRPKPCPFCGEDDSISLVIKELTQVHVECSSCGAQAPAVSSDDQEDDGSTYSLVLKAAKQWNTRNGGAS